MSETDITPEVLPSEEDNGGASGAAPEALSLEEISAHLGKQFPSKEAALKAMKDTFKFAVTKEETIKAKVLSELSSKVQTDELAKEVSELKKNAFYDKKPEYAEYRGIIDKLGSNPAEIVESPEFKAIFEKAQEGVKAQKSRTVLDSNPRLGQAIDNMSEAREALKAGDTGKAANLAVESVLSAYNVRR
jgi:hypothetical protein